MFCPNCGSEYVQGLIVYSECKVPLVNEPPGQTKPEFIRFVTVYETGNPATIAFVKSIFQSEGIRYFCKGEVLQDFFAGGRLGTGFNPIIGSVQIQVDEKDVEKAKELLKQIEESDFELLESDAEHNRPETLESGPPKKHSSKDLFKGIIIGVLISGIVFLVYDYRKKHFSGVENYDLNKDSKPDLFYVYRDGVIDRIEEDRNFDGKIDRWDFFKDGNVDHGESDDYFDGIVDTLYYYKNGILSRVEIDTNSDKKPGIVEYYSNGVLYEKLWYDESSRNPWKRALFVGGIKKEEYIDQDYDGTFDIKINYDSSEHPVETRSLH
jgi:hypothetical protein